MGKENARTVYVGMPSVVACMLMFNVSSAPLMSYVVGIVGLLGTEFSLHSLVLDERQHRLDCSDYVCVWAVDCFIIYVFIIS